MFCFLKKCVRNAMAWCALWNEVWLFVLTVLLWPVAAWLIVFVGGEGTLTFDFGIPMSALYSTILLYGAIHAFVWVGIYLNFRFLWNFYQHDFQDTFNQLNPWHRMLIAFLFLSLYFCTSLYTLQAVLSTAMAPVQTTVPEQPAY